MRLQMLLRGVRMPFPSGSRDNYSETALPALAIQEAETNGPKNQSVRLTIWLTARF